MIVTIIQFALDESIDGDRARAMFADSIEKFFGMTGLNRKYYLLSEDAAASASVYLWDSRERAENFFTDAWMDFIGEKYGHRPTVTYYECPIVIDNVTHEVLKSDKQIPG